MATGDTVILEHWVGASGETTWTSEVSGSGVWFPNFDTSLIGQPALWGPRCLWNDHVLNQAAFGAINIPSVTASRVCAWEFLVSQESLADNGIANIFSVKHDGLPSFTTGDNQLIGRFQFMQVAGVYYLSGFIQYDGNNNNPLVVPVQLNTIYRVEFEWDLANKVWGCWMNGAVNSSGTISGSATTWNLNTIQPGGTFIDTAAATHFMGPLIVYQGPRDSNKWEEQLATSWVRSDIAHPAKTLAPTVRADRARSGRFAGLRP